MKKRVKPTVTIRTIPFTEGGIQYEIRAGKNHHSVRLRLTQGDLRTIAKLSAAIEGDMAHTSFASWRDCKRAIFTAMGVLAESFSLEVEVKP